MSTLQGESRSVLTAAYVNAAGVPALAEGGWLPAPGFYRLLSHGRAPALEAGGLTTIRDGDTLAIRECVASLDQ
jgi:hypothetical protein